MRKFASCQFFCIERSAVTEKVAELLEALRSFQMMNSARFIVFYESVKDGLIKELLQIGATNIVTGSELEEKLPQIAECLTDDGMLKYRHAGTNDGGCHEETECMKDSLVDSIISKELENEPYRFDCVNISIGVIGSTRKVGTTTTALSLASFIKNHGGTVCYVALNVNRHLESIAEEYGFDVEDEYYTYDAIDFYEGMKPKHNYNFVIIDFGDLYHGEIRREAVRGFKGCDVHLLCGARNRRFETVELREALKAVKSVKPRILTEMINLESNELFGSIIENSANFFRSSVKKQGGNVNNHIYSEIIKEYIVETEKKL